jgi:hypothetical protein
VKRIFPVYTIINNFQVLNSLLYLLKYHEKSSYVKQGSMRKTQDVDVQCQRRIRRKH